MTLHLPHDPPTELLAAAKMRHLTDTGPRAGFPICGAPWTDKAEGSMHAVYWHADKHGRDYCSACMRIMDEVDAGEEN